MPTEAALLDDQAIANATELDQRGIRLQIDDFGTGYSSLSYLHRFPSESVKIDRSFISGLPFETTQAEIIRSVVTLAHNLGRTVIAEGVETAVQLHSLEELGCDYAQGFLLARPIDGHLVPAMLSGRFIKDLEEA